MDAGAEKKSVLLSIQSSSFSLPGRVTWVRNISRNSSRSVILQLHILEDALQDGQLVVAQGDAFAHAGAIRGPVADVVLGFAFVPADEVELALPAAGTLSEDCDALNDLVLDFCHSSLPAFALFPTIIKEAREDFNR